MTKELELQLVKKYPDLFVDYGGDMRQTCMAWGIEASDGWYRIIDNLCEMLQSKTQKPWIVLKKEFQTNKKVCAEVLTSPTIKFAQVKSKFATLRAYLNTEFSPYEDKFDEQDYNKKEEYWRGQISGIVAFAELLSSQTCEVTGKPGKLRTDIGWIKTLCDEEYDKIKQTK